jgi:hypothetical protein
VAAVLDERLRSVAALYEEHRQAAFPRRLVVDDVNGVEMVMLDSRPSGCISTWLQNGGRVDGRVRDTLAECEQLLLRVLPALDGDERAYYNRLLEMTLLILENPDDVTSRP